MTYVVLLSDRICIATASLFFDTSVDACGSEFVVQMSVGVERLPFLMDVFI